MDSLKEAIQQCELSNSIKRYKLINSVDENLIIESNSTEKNDVFIPMELVEENREALFPEMEKLESKHLDIGKLSAFKTILLNHDLPFKTPLIGALTIDDPQLYFSDFINTSDTQSIKRNESLYDPSYIIPKQTLINLLETARKKVLSSSRYNDDSYSKLYDKIMKAYDDKASRIASASEPTIDSEIPPKYTDIINNLFSLKVPPMRKIINDTPQPYFKVIDFDDEFELPKDKMAMTFPFELDKFQKKAIFLLEQNENVLVAAHTSAGKTVIAEYAIARSISFGKKTIYTSPVKALSNQKFYDFKKKFKDVGIVTGDVQINDTGQVVVMTTEILRSILYREVLDKLSDVCYVVFDEAHYINDEERGVVWEEIIIMLPKHIKLVLLSATIPNCHEVAGWIGKVRQQTINVILTKKRPIPLEHVLYYGDSSASKDAKLPVIDIDGEFLIGNFLAVKRVLAEKAEKQSSYSDKFYGPRHFTFLLDHLKCANKLPCIIFSFSRKGCSETCERISKNLDFTTKTEKFLIKKFFESCISRITKKDQELPQIRLFRQYCQKGFAVHHSGILPLLREIVEILFQRELVKVLFATETFAMGVNMPAKTVVFSSLKKFSGNENGNRYLLSSEYIQMAGRAGRRGQDTTGSVYIMSTFHLPSEQEFKEMTIGNAMRVTSRFRLTYGMIMNLLSGNKTDNKRIENVMRSNFSEFIQFSSYQETRQKILRLEVEMNKFISDSKTCDVCSDLPAYFDVCQRYGAVWKKIQSLSISSRAQLSNFYCEGRLVILKLGKLVHCRHGIVLNPPKLPINQSSINLSSVFVTILFPHNSSDRPIKQIFDSTNSDYCLSRFDYCYDNITKFYLYEVSLDCIVFVTSKKIKINVPNLKQSQQTKNPHLILIDDNSELFRLKRVFIELSSEITDYNIFSSERIEIKKSGTLDDNEFQKLLIQYSFICNHCSISKFSCLNCQNIDQHWQILIEQNKMKDKIEEEKCKISSEDLIFMPDYFKRVEVLKKLDLIDHHNNLTIKGKVALKFTNNFEIVLTQLLFSGFFKDISPQNLAAVLSCFTEQGQTKPAPNNSQKFKYGLENILHSITDILDKIDDYEYIQNLNTCERPVSYQHMVGMYEWALGCSFESLLKTTNLQEGNLIRHVLRIDEICKELEKAAVHIGNLELQTCAKTCRQLIKRDIINVSSLYLTEQI